MVAAAREIIAAPAPTAPAVACGSSVTWLISFNDAGPGLFWQEAVTHS